MTTAIFWNDKEEILTFVTFFSQRARFLFYKERIDYYNVEKLLKLLFRKNRRSNHSLLGNKIILSSSLRSFLKDEFFFLKNQGQDLQVRVINENENVEGFRRFVSFLENVLSSYNVFGEQERPIPEQVLEDLEELGFLIEEVDVSKLEEFLGNAGNIYLEVYQLFLDSFEERESEGEGKTFKDIFVKAFYPAFLKMLSVSFDIDLVRLLGLKTSLDREAYSFLKTSYVINGKDFSYYNELSFVIFGKRLFPEQGVKIFRDYPRRESMSRFYKKLRDYDLEGAYFYLLFLKTYYSGSVAELEEEFTSALRFSGEEKDSVRSRLREKLSVFKTPKGFYEFLSERASFFFEDVFSDIRVSVDDTLLSERLLRLSDDEKTVNAFLQKTRKVRNVLKSFYLTALEGRKDEEKEFWEVFERLCGGYFNIELYPYHFIWRE